MQAFSADDTRRRKIFMRSDQGWIIPAKRCINGGDSRASNTACAFLL